MNNSLPGEASTPEEAAAPTPLDLDTFNEALQFVTQAHAKQLRKGTSVPYITHVVAVAEALAYYYPERHDLVLAGLLHDAVEDTDLTLDEVRKRFGDRVAVLVAAVTKPEDLGVPPELVGDKAAVWRHKRQAMLDQLDANDKDILRLKAADALANQLAIWRDSRNPNVGETIWGRFKVGKEDSLWYYQEILTHVQAALGDEAIVRELQEVHEALKRP